MQDIQATLDDKVSSKVSKATGAQEKSEISGVDVGNQTTMMADDVDGQQRTESAAAGAAPKLKTVLHLATESPCMTKADLQDFVGAQLNAMANVLSINPGQQEIKRKAYKWPTQSLGSQVGPSLTELTGQENVADGEKACDSKFRSSNKSKKRS